MDTKTFEQEVNEEANEFNKQHYNLKHEILPRYDYLYKRKTNNNRERIYGYIRGFIGINGFAPTHREIAKALDIKSLSTVAFHIGKLVEDKRLAKHPEIARCLIVVDSEYTQTVYGATAKKGFEVEENYIMKKTKAVEGVGDWEKRFNKQFNVYTASPIKYECVDVRAEIAGKDVIVQYGGIGEIKQFIKKELEKAEERVMKEAVELSDKIEMDTPNTEFEEWRAFKRFRNTLRDRYELKFQKNNYEKGKRVRGNTNGLRS